LAIIEIGKIGRIIGKVHLLNGDDHESWFIQDPKVAPELVQVVGQENASEEVKRSQSGASREISSAAILFTVVN
jgi:hypothetical protein